MTKRMLYYHFEIFICVLDWVIPTTTTTTSVQHLYSRHLLMIGFLTLQNLGPISDARLHLEKSGTKSLGEITCQRNVLLRKSRGPPIKSPD